jgi:hypothetical protein
MTLDEINRYVALVALHQTVGYGAMSNALVLELRVLTDKAYELGRRK